MRKRKRLCKFGEVIRTVHCIIEENNIATYHVLKEHLQQNNLTVEHNVACKHAYHFITYMKSRRRVLASEKRATQRADKSRPENN